MFSLLKYFLKIIITTKRITAKKGSEGKDSYMVIQSLLPPTPNSSVHTYGAVPLEIEEGFVTHHDYKHESDEKHDTSIIDLGPSEVVDEVSVVANTINALIGVSLFAMPWGFQQAGVLGGLVILTIVGSLSYDTTRMLLVSQKHYFQVSGEVLSYPEIAASALGEVWYRVVQIATIISCVGGSTGYLIFFGETVGQALSMKSSTVLLIATTPLIMLCLIKSFRELTIFTVFGVIALVIAVFAIIIDGSTKVDPNFDDVTILKFSTLQNCLGPVTFLFTVHYTVLAMSAEILRVSPWIADKVNEEPENSFKGLTYPIALSYFLSSVFVAVLGIAGFVMYRNVVLVTDPDGNLLIGCDGHVCQNIILNLSPGIARNIVGITMSVVIVLSYVLNIAPAREHIENMILS